MFSVFDAATLREELSVLEANLKQNPRDEKSLKLFINYARKLREAEHRESGYVTARNGVTGY